MAVSTQYVSTINNVIGTTWAATSNALGSTQATYATFTSSVSSAIGTVDLTQFDFSSIPAGSTISAVSVTTRGYVNNISRTLAPQAQLFDGATAIGALQTLSTIFTVGVLEQVWTPTVLPTLAQLKSALFKCVFTARKAASTQSGITYLDLVHIDVTYTAPVAPSAPTAITATAGNAQATVSFTLGASGNSAITGSTITSTPDGFTGVVPGTGTSGTVTGLTNGTAYTFTVTSTSAIGTSSASAASNSVTPVPPVPVAPGVFGVFANYEYINIQMPASFPANATSFSLYENGVLLQANMAISEVKNTGYRDPTITYLYTCRAVGLGGTSPDSAAVSGVPAPNVATGLTATKNSSSQITLTWNAKTYSTTPWYLLTRDGVDFLWLTAGETSYVDTGRAASTLYTYHISVSAQVPTVRNTGASSDVSAVTDNAPLLNPNMVQQLGGPSGTYNRNDMMTGGFTVYRDPHTPWSAASRTWAGLEFIPQMWRDFFANPVVGIIYFILGQGAYPGLVNNYSSVMGYAGLWLGDHTYIVGDMEEKIILHELGHHINHLIRPSVGLGGMFDGQVNSAVTLAQEVLAAVHAMDAANPPMTQYGGTNIDELTAEAYRTLVIMNADPSFLVVPAGSNPWTAGIRADAWFTWMCNGDAGLSARWLTELKNPLIWPAAPWTVYRIPTITQTLIDTRRNTLYGTGIPIQDLDSNEGPTLLLADKTNGYSVATMPPGVFTTPSWGRFDRPLRIPVDSALAVVAGTPTAEVSNLNVSVANDAIPNFNLQGGPSERWRVTVTFRVAGSLPTTKTVLWYAVQTIQGVVTEYEISYMNAVVSASLIVNGSATTISSGNILVADGERVTVQAVWGAQASAITLRHRLASAVVVTTLTSVAMPVGRKAVGLWSMPLLRQGTSYCLLAAISVEAIHDDTIGPFTWMDVEYS